MLLNFIIKQVKKFWISMLKFLKGDMSDLLIWLREKIHIHGQRFDAKDLCKKITGEELNFKYFMKYAQEKYSNIYKLKD